MGVNKDSEKKVADSAKEQAPVEVLSLCSEQTCVGIKPTFKHLDVSNDDCPICLESLNSKSVLMLDRCRHKFCEDCIQRYQTDKGCPMCRQSYDGYVTLTVLVACSDLEWQELFDLHRGCAFECDPFIKEYLRDLNRNWMKLVEFLFRSQSLGEKYLGIKGIEYLFLDKPYCDEVLKTEKCYAVTKKGTKSQVVMGCLMPYTALKLLITKNVEQNDTQQDDEYADTVVGHVTHQLETCWRAFQSLLSDQSLHRIFIRKFKTVTCSLMIVGFQHNGSSHKHHTPMKEQIKNMKKCNFDDSMFNPIKNSFPPCKRANMETPKGYTETKCCK